MKFLIFIVLLVSVESAYVRLTSAQCDGIFVGGICHYCQRNCTSCTRPGGCSSCDGEKYVLSNGQCVVSQSYKDEDEFNAYKNNLATTEARYCDKGCSSSGAFICTSCLTGSRARQGYCEACTVENCKKCDADSSTCEKCKDTYYYDADLRECLPCSDPYCLECSSEEVCTKCIETTVYLDDGLCVSCNVDGCAVCSQVSLCETCLNNYYKNGSVCSSCGTHAAICNNNGSITQCKEGYALINNVCYDVSQVYRLRDPSSCRTFVNQVTCASCFEGYSVVSGICKRTTCQNDEYADTSDGNACKTCGTGILTCTFSSPTITATACKTGYYLTGSTCTACSANSLFGSNKDKIRSCSSTQVLTCVDGFTTSQDSTSCVSCGTGCLSCELAASSNTVSSCLSCKTGYVKSDDNAAICLQCDTQNRCVTCNSKNQVECLTCNENYFITPFSFCSNSIRYCYSIGDYGCSKCRVGFKRSENHFACFDCKSENTCATQCLPSDDQPPQDDLNFDDSDQSGSMHLHLSLLLITILLLT